MEQIKYIKTLDVHKSGSQFLLTGFQTGDSLSRVVEISLMASGDAIDFPLENVLAIMYVTEPESETESLECEIVDNKVVFNVPRIQKEGITEMQLKLIETSVDGAKSVTVAPMFSVEVTKSHAEDNGVENTKEFTAFEKAVAKAKSVYDKRFLRMELTNDCIFKAYYADGTTYETDILKKLFHDGNVALAESFAHGGTGTRVGEDTDNAMYFSNVSKSAAEEAKNAEQNSGKLLEETKLHSIYTTFSVDFETGEMKYISPSFNFNINIDTGELEVEGKGLFDDEIGNVVSEWLEKNGVDIAALLNVSEFKSRLDSLEVAALRHDTNIGSLQSDVIAAENRIEGLEKRTTPLSLGGTGAVDAENARKNLGLENFAQIDVYSYTGKSTSQQQYPRQIPFEKFKPKVLFFYSPGVITQPVVYGAEYINSTINKDSSSSFIQRGKLTWNDDYVQIDYMDGTFDSVSLSASLNKDGVSYTCIMIG